MAITTAWSNWSSSGTSTSHAPTLPGSRTGKRVFAFVTADIGSSPTFSTNWTSLYNGGSTQAQAGRQACLYRDCDGNATNDALTFTLNTAASARVGFVVLTNADLTTPPEFATSS